MRKIPTKLTYETESIRTQRKQFFDILNNQISILRTRNNYKDTAGLEKIVFNFTGLTIIFKILDNATEYGLAIVPVIKSDSPLSKGMNISNDKMLDYLKGTATNILKGTVDTKNCKVSGFFSQLISTIYLNKQILTNTLFSNEEITAILLHEIGHIFCYYEYLDRTYSTNQILFSSFKLCTSSDNFKKREYYISLTADQLDIKVNSSILAKEQNETVFNTLIALKSAKRESELNSVEYDTTSSEQLADQFATRCGAGLYLVKALEKIYLTNYPTYKYKKQLTLGCSNVQAAIVCFAELVEKAFKQINNSLISGLILLCSNSESIPKKNLAFYDDEVVRLKRIKEDLIQQLKLNLSNDDKQNIIKQINGINFIINIYDRNKNILSNIFDCLFRSKFVKNANNQMALQRQLEELSANDFFIHAENFKNLPPN